MAQEHEVAVGRYVLMPDHAHVFCIIALDRYYAPKMGSGVASGDRETITQARIRQTALAERLLRSSSSNGRKLFSEMGLRSNESSARRIERARRNLAISG